MLDDVIDAAVIHAVGVCGAWYAWYAPSRPVARQVRVAAKGRLVHARCRGPVAKAAGRVGALQCSGACGMPGGALQCRVYVRAAAARVCTSAVVGTLASSAAAAGHGTWVR